jgi:hypothetical protein
VRIFSGSAGLQGAGSDARNGCSRNRRVRRSFPAALTWETERRIPAQAINGRGESGSPEIAEISACRTGLSGQAPSLPGSPMCCSIRIPPGPRRYPELRVPSMVTRQRKDDGMVAMVDIVALPVYA